MKLLYSGKAKSIFETDDPSRYLMRFRDDTSRFDGELIKQLDRKGHVNNCINAFIMEHLEMAGVSTHFIEKTSEIDSIVDALKMFPIESVIRNVAAGSFTKRFGIEEGTRLPHSIQEFFLKNDELHDPMISDTYITSYSLASQVEIDEVRRLSFRINDLLTHLFKEAKIQVVDFKLEFGIDKQGRLVLADEVTPDGMRLWDLDTQEKLDKDRFRRDLGGVVEHYEEVAKRLGVPL